MQVEITKRVLMLKAVVEVTKNVNLEVPINVTLKPARTVAIKLRKLQAKAIQKNLSRARVYGTKIAKRVRYLLMRTISIKTR